MLAPVALYPDALLSQVLMAATYPVERGRGRALVARQPRPAGRRRGARSAGRGLGPEREVAGRVSADAGSAWTSSSTGRASSATPSSRRSRRSWTRCSSCAGAPQAAGNLQSSEQITRRSSRARRSSIQPAAPQYVYVPYYDPLVVYGPWWWPAYRPVVLGAVARLRATLSSGRLGRLLVGQPVGLSVELLLRQLRLASAARARRASDGLLLPAAGGREPDCRGRSRTLAA